MNKEQLSLQIFRSAQTGSVKLVGAGVLPDNFKTWILLHQREGLETLRLPIITATTFFTIPHFTDTQTVA